MFQHIYLARPRDGERGVFNLAYFHLGLAFYAIVSVFTRLFHSSRIRIVRSIRRFCTSSGLDELFDRRDTAERLFPVAREGVCVFTFFLTDQFCI